MLPKTSAYVKHFDGQTKWIYFLIEDDDLSEENNTIWYKINVDIKRKFDNEAFYNKNYLKTKIKCRGDEVTDFYDIKSPRSDSNHTSLAVISLDSALKKDIICKDIICECKYTEKEVVRHIHENLSDFSYSFDESDEE